MIFHTENSVYHLDKSAKKVRRLAGENEPTEQFSPEGEWKKYESYGWLGDRILFDFGDGKGTLTSKVTSWFE